MSSEDLNLLSQIVAGYTNPDQKIRSESEKFISDFRNKSMGAICSCLLKVTSLKNISSTIKLTSLVLLRKIISVDSKDKWGDIDEETKNSIKTLVLELFLILHTLVICLHLDHLLILLFYQLHLLL